MIHGLKQDLALAHQRHDDGPAHQVIAIQRQPSHYGQPPLIQMVVVLLQRLGVLAVGCAHPADRGYTQADEIAVGLGAVALEIAVQAPLPLGDRQRIRRQGKVVHAYIDVTGINERVQRTRKHGHLG